PRIGQQLFIGVLGLVPGVLEDIGLPQMDIEMFHLRARHALLPGRLQQGARLFVVPDGLVDGQDGPRLIPGLPTVPRGALGLAWLPSTALAITSWRVAGASFARRARIIARTEGGNSARRDRSCARAAAISTVGSSRQLPSAPCWGTSHCRSRNSLSVSSRYNGCPPVCANRKSPSPSSGRSDASAGSDPAG